MKIHLLYNPKPRTDLGAMLDKNFPNELVRLMQELAKSVIEINSKVREPNAYDEVINDPINRNGRREAIDEELWNLDSHQT